MTLLRVISMFNRKSFEFINTNKIERISVFLWNTHAWGVIGDVYFKFWHVLKRCIVSCLSSVWLEHSTCLMIYSKPIIFTRLKLRLKFGISRLLTSSIENTDKKYLNWNGYNQWSRSSQKYKSVKTYLIKFEFFYTSFNTRAFNTHGTPLKIIFEEYWHEWVKTVRCFFKLLPHNFSIKNLSIQVNSK